MFYKLDVQHFGYKVPPGLVTLLIAMAASKVVKLNQKKSEKHGKKKGGKCGKGAKKVKARPCPVAQRPTMARCPFSLSRKLHSKFAAMFLDCTCSWQKSNECGQNLFDTTTELGMCKGLGIKGLALTALHWKIQRSFFMHGPRSSHTATPQM